MKRDTDHSCALWRRHSSEARLLAHQLNELASVLSGECTRSEVAGEDEQVELHTCARMSIFDGFCPSQEHKCLPTLPTPPMIHGQVVERECCEQVAAMARVSTHAVPCEGELEGSLEQVIRLDKF